MTDNNTKNNLSIDTINYLQGLMKISVGEDKKELFLKQISDIVSYITDITSVNIPHREYSKSANDNILREDNSVISNNHFAKSSLNTEEKLGDYYKVSQVIK